MSYGKIVAGLGIALVVLLALSAGITLAAQWRQLMQTPFAAWPPHAWGMHGMQSEDKYPMMYGKYESEDHTCPMMDEWHGKGKGGKYANLTTIDGTVKSVNITRGFIVVTSDGEDYRVFVGKVYVRTSDGVLIFGGWILGNVKQGDPITVKGFGKNSNVVAVEITWKDNTYQYPGYYMYLLRSG